MTKDIKYYRDRDGIHWYKITGKNVLHVCYVKEDIEITEEVNNIYLIGIMKKGEALINNPPYENIQVQEECTEEEFNDILTLAKNQLGI